MAGNPQLASTTYSSLSSGSGWAPLSSDPELAYHPEAYGLRYNRAGRFLLCPREQCQTALTLVAAEQHLKTHKKANEVSLIGPWIKNFAKICTPLQLSGQLPTGLRDIQPFSGLAIQNVFQCLLESESPAGEVCYKMFSCRASFRTHLHKAHSSSFSRLPATHQGPAFRMGLGQQFFRGSPYFSVIPPFSPPLPIQDTVTTSVSPSPGTRTSVPQWLANLEDEINSSLQIPTRRPGDTRVIEEWINRLGWNDHLSQYSDWAWLETLVAMPTRLEFPWLNKATLALFQDALRRIPYTPDLSLKILQTPPPPSSAVM